MKIKIQNISSIKTYPVGYVILLMLVILSQTSGNLLSKDHVNVAARLRNSCACLPCFKKLCNSILIHKMHANTNT